ncbi:MAG: alanine racemase [Chlorobi bacterium]|nr:alanine racemase [Chlorobiota bacterium]
MKITKPIFLINEQICKKNIRLMAEKARKKHLEFRPHFKTHQSAEIGEWFREAGVSKITVSSVSMAIYFADHGWEDILIAFPVNILEIDEINKLAQEIKLFLTVESIGAVQFLEENMDSKASVYIKTDTGYHRTGILPTEINQIDEILNIVSSSANLNLTGFLAHSGNTYEANSKREIIDIHEESIRQLSELKSRYIRYFPELRVSIGDTPSCSLAENFGDIDEIRPGNYVFYDVMQYFLGACSMEDIAVAIACPVVAKHTDRMEIVLYGGAVHLSKESVIDNKGKEIFGLPVKINDLGWSKPLSYSYVSRLSQEHGILQTRPDVFDSIQIGDIIGVLPVHSCLAANLAKQYFSFGGKEISKM